MVLVVSWGSFPKRTAYSFSFHIPHSPIGVRINEKDCHRGAFTILNARNTRKSNGGRTKKNNNPKKKRASNTDASTPSKKKSRSQRENSKNSSKNKSVSPTAKAKNKVNSSNAHLPPWQIMSEKDTKKNIEAEKNRRAAVREGTIASSAEVTGKIADASSSSHLLSLSDRKLLGWKRFSPREGRSQGLEFSGAYLGTEGMESLGVPEVAFLGRSNVGKSSLLNQLAPVGSGEGARVGKTPGATASVNLYTLKDEKKNKVLLGMADLPGFGYAKLSRDRKEAVEVAAERYLGKRKELALGILLVDARREPSDDDRGVLAALFDLGVPLIVVATKVDKLSSNQRSQALEAVRIGLGLPVGQPLCVSSVTREGVKQLWGIIMDACEERVDELKTEIEGEVDEGSAEDDDIVLLDDSGNLIEDEEGYDQGFEWVQSYETSLFGKDKKEIQSHSHELSEESLLKMKENQERQAIANNAMKFKNLKKIAKGLESEGKV
jgi:GTP-binding protein